MRDDPFDDVRCPFDYKAELNRARDALNEKVRDYAARTGGVGYQELAKMFRLSPGTLYAIAKGSKKMCKPGPRTRKQKIAVKILRSHAGQ